ncbi:hypothetical protein GCM10027074_20040 [Streptomyces deserti]
MRNSRALAAAGAAIAVLGLAAPTAVAWDGVPGTSTTNDGGPGNGQNNDGGFGGNGNGGDDGGFGGNGNGGNGNGGNDGGFGGNGNGGNDGGFGGNGNGGKEGGFGGNGNGRDNGGVGGNGGGNGGREGGFGGNGDGRDNGGVGGNGDGRDNGGVGGNGNGRDNGGNGNRGDNGGFGGNGNGGPNGNAGGNGNHAVGPSNIVALPSVIARGGQLTITVDGCRQGGTATSNAFPRTTLTPIRGANDTAKGTATIHADARPGTYDITVNCSGRTLTRPAAFTVIGGVRGGLGGSSSSGATPTDMAIGGSLVAVAVIGGGVFWMRRRAEKRI